MADARIPLSDMIAELRHQLAAAQAQGVGQEPRLKVEEAEIEVQVAITREGSGAGSVKFWVVNAETKGKLASTNTQKIRVKLRPTDAAGGDLVIDATEEDESC